MDKKKSRRFASVNAWVHVPRIYVFPAWTVHTGQVLWPPQQNKRICSAIVFATRRLNMSLATSARIVFSGVFMRSTRIVCHISRGVSARVRCSPTWQNNSISLCCPKWVWRAWRSCLMVPTAVNRSWPKVIKTNIWAFAARSSKIFCWLTASWTALELFFVQDQQFRPQIPCKFCESVGFFCFVGTSNSVRFFRW